MPQTNAAKKALRTDKRRRARNDRWRRRLRTALHEVRDALTQAKKKEAEAAYVKAQGMLDRAAQRNVIHANKAARKKSQLKQAIAKLK